MTYRHICIFAIYKRVVLFFGLLENSPEHCLHIGINTVHTNYLRLVQHRAILFYNFQDLTFQYFSTHEGPGDFSSVLLEFMNRLKSHVTLIDNILCWAHKGFWRNILLSTD